MLYMRMVRSPVAFGRLTGIRIVEALAHPGTVAIWTAEDVADIPPIGFRMTPVPGVEPYRQPVLANGHARYVGEPIAVVFAADPYTAEDIADLVESVIEPLIPRLDPTARRANSRQDAIPRPLLSPKPTAISTLPLPKRMRS